MQGDWIRDFFTKINTILPELADNLNRDNGLSIEKNLNKIETMVRQFRKKVKVNLKEINEGRKKREWLEDDQL